MTLRSSPRVRAVAQILLVVTLIGIAFAIMNLRTERDRDAATTDALATILADACGAASARELREEGIAEECRLAEEGDLPEAIPADALPEPDEAPEADVLPDQPTAEQVEAAVAEYFEDFTLPGDYGASVQRAVNAYLTANPPSPQPPSREEIQRAVRAVLLANPPADGQPGDAGDVGDPGEPGPPGRGVSSAAVEGCDVVFTYTDGTVSRVGPLCGPTGAPGPAPSNDEIAAAVVAYCAANGECRGPAGAVGVAETADQCNPDSGLVTDVGLAYDPETRTITLTCETVGGNPLN